MAGYSSSGSSLTKPALKTWTPNHLSSKTDIDYNLKTLRNRAFDLSINSLIGAAYINTMVTGTICSGLKFFPKINAEELGITSKQARKWRCKVKQEFSIWAEHCDFLLRNSFEKLQIIAF